MSCRRNSPRSAIRSSPRRDPIAGPPSRAAATAVAGGPRRSVQALPLFPAQAETSGGGSRVKQEESRSATPAARRVHTLIGVAAIVAFAPMSVPLALLQAQRPGRVFTRADTLRGTITPERAWWDVTFYDLHVAISPADSTIRGWNGITYRVVRPATREMQIDLQVPLDVDSMVQDGRRLTYRRDGNAFFTTIVRSAGREQRADHCGLLPRAPTGRQAAAVGRRLHLGARQPGTSLDRHDVSGTGGQRLVADQGHPGRRAGQPAYCDHRSRLAPGRLQRTPAIHRPPSRRDHHVRVVRR